MIDIKDVRVIEGDLSEPRDQEALVELISAYLNDDMGERRLLGPAAQKELVSGLREHPAKLLFFARYSGKAVGLATCFLGFSTFYAKKLINIHDLIVKPEFRRQGIAGKLLLFIEEKARNMDCCKLTLEVRADNKKAMALYKKSGFSPGEPAMRFWTKKV